MDLLTKRALAGWFIGAFRCIAVHKSKRTIWENTTRSICWVLYRTQTFYQLISSYWEKIKSLESLHRCSKLIRSSPTASVNDISGCVSFASHPSHSSTATPNHLVFGNCHGPRLEFIRVRNSCPPFESSVSRFPKRGESSFGICVFIAPNESDSNGNNIVPFLNETTQFHGPFLSHSLSPSSPSWAGSVMNGFNESTTKPKMRV